jgi:adenine-specific DNA-methyltransferase
MAFARIAPLLWMRAGSRGRRIDDVPAAGWELVDTYGLLTDLDQTTPFLEAIRKSSDVHIAYIVTEDERRFQALARRLPERVEAVRLYESYLTNFAFANGSEGMRSEVRMAIDDAPAASALHEGALAMNYPYA